MLQYLIVENFFTWQNFVLVTKIITDEINFNLITVLNKKRTNIKEKTGNTFHIKYIQ